MKHLQRRTPAEWLNDLVDEVKAAIVPETPKEWIVLLMFLFLMMVTASQQDNLNKLYAHVLALMEAAK